MWNLIRCIVVVLALAGFVGQTTARAMPMTMDQASPASKATVSMMNCADMAQTAPLKAPCKGMTPDCIGKMGCSTVASPLPMTLGVTAPVAYSRVAFANVDQTREGVSTPLPYHPPQQLA